MIRHPAEYGRAIYQHIRAIFQSVRTFLIKIVYVLESIHLSYEWSVMYLDN